MIGFKIGFKTDLYVTQKVDFQHSLIALKDNVYDCFNTFL